ncbi:ABC transporter permease [Asticcacaulis sp. EMRT-3]|uniref:cell division protein FtsX n=1 Tax=Asticcacaulis sp. EMRT-3 TaxID=3040349 RepID=UPI0024AFFB87|nr:ABC transporter permease [Asticcacaulis sp. EMRT-3]MDI7776041.1 ABC transporter permease [Asticcacaulis sp. EMRT-3]
MIGPLLSRFQNLRARDLLPRQDEREVALHYVIGVLCFLACMAALTVMASDRAAAGWSRDIHAEVTVQVRPSGLESGSVAAARAAEVLAGVKGVGQVTALEPEKAKDLIKPWLGDAVLDDLPIPNLVEVRLDPRHPASLHDLKTALSTQDIDASIDDHTVWLKDVQQSALTIRLLSLGIFLIIGSATAAVVGFATRAGLTARANIVEVLSLCGASDIFIAERFQNRFARMAFESGLLGAGLAALAMTIIKITGRSQSFTLALPFSWPDLLILIPCPVLVALTAAVTARMVTLKLLGGSGHRGGEI